MSSGPIQGSSSMLLSSSLVTIHLRWPATNTILNLYIKCGRGLDGVLQLFDRMPLRDQVPWNSLIAALCRKFLWTTESSMGTLDVWRKIFESTEVKDLVFSNKTITTYDISVRHDDALLLLNEMQRVCEVKDGNSSDF
ncbi:hypothetical protein NE237_027107 [Protea cynaroides]|uniref:Pentatricopeptide repeat-containing protein n=1 Tax=Protea cynaroides TaxID=273540 RepID=A0A9Q0GPV3_9MAGN|nr:hypothetical protein NE237_027107 [Protea cynaroides]